MNVPFVKSTAGSRSIRRVVFLVFCLIVGGSITGVLTRSYWGTPRPNVILVTLDTTRSDRLGIYGYEKGLTQEFDDFCRRGVVFERAYAPAPLTLPSHATLLTGLYPPEHGLRVNGAGRLDNNIPLLSEILKEHGYQTSAFIAAAVLDSNYGLARGFDTYDDKLPEAKSAGHHGEARRDGTEIVDSALSWIKQRNSRPFFAWVHLYDAHAPYDSRPDAFGAKFEHTPYDAGVAWEVRQFGRLMSFLKSHNLEDNTLVIVAGDHGEGLGDHQENEHGMLIYDTTLHVPFVFVGTNFCKPGTKVPEVVSLVDLTPTVLDLLQIPPPEHVSGRSLLTALQGNPVAPRHCYAETETPYLYSHWAPLHAVITDRWKYIRTTRPELYDLQHDSGELNNLAEAAQDECQEMRAALEILQESFVQMSAQNLILTEKDLKNLESLGYVSGGSTADHTTKTSETETLPDVKDMLPYIEKFERAQDLGVAGRYGEAMPLLVEIVESTGKFDAAEALLGDCFARAGQLDKAAASYRKVLVKRPDFSAIRFKLGKLLASQGQWGQAAAEFRELNRQTPETPTGHFELGEVLAEMKKFDESIIEYRHAIRLAPEYVSAHLRLGQLLFGLGRPQEATVCFTNAVKFAPDAAEIHAHLMIALSQTGSVIKAIEHGRKAVALAPESFENRFNLGVLFATQKLYKEGLVELREAHRLRPEDPRPAEQIERVEAARKNF